MKIKLVVMLAIGLVLGVLAGSFLFRGVQPRSFTAIAQCQTTCLNPNELTGLAASVGIQHLTSVLPLVVRETDKTVVFRNPTPQAPVHYLIVPKKDIKDVGQISDENETYIADMFTVMSDIIRQEHLRNYQIATNGPGFQTVNYLHFHLLGNGTKRRF